MNWPAAPSAKASPRQNKTPFISWRCREIRGGGNYYLFTDIDINIRGMNHPHQTGIFLLDQLVMMIG